MTTETRIPIVKAKANVALKIELKWCDYSPSKNEEWPDQLRLTGRINGEESRIYVPLGLENDLAEHGFIQRTGDDDRWGMPAFEVLSADPFELLKVERDNGPGYLYQVGALNGKPTPADATSPRPTPSSSAPTSDDSPEVLWLARQMYLEAVVLAAHGFDELNENTRAITISGMIELRRDLVPPAAYLAAARKTVAKVGGVQRREPEPPPVPVEDDPEDDLPFNGGR